jgi:hypothetical protein
MVLLILDRFAGHRTEMSEEAFIQCGAFETVLLVRSSDQIQPLDLGIFVIHKMELHRNYTRVRLNSQTRKLLKRLCGSTKAIIRQKITIEFGNGGVIGEWNEEANSLVCRVDLVAASQRRRWNGSKERVDISMALDQRGGQGE